MDIHHMVLRVQLQASALVKGNSMRINLIYTSDIEQGEEDQPSQEMERTLPSDLALLQI